MNDYDSFWKGSDLSNTLWCTQDHMVFLKLFRLLSAKTKMGEVFGIKAIERNTVVPHEQQASRHNGYLAKVIPNTVTADESEIFDDVVDLRQIT